MSPAAYTHYFEYHLCSRVSWSHGGAGNRATAVSCRAEGRSLGLTHYPPLCLSMAPPLAEMEVGSDAARLCVTVSDAAQLPIPRACRRETPVAVTDGCIASSTCPHPGRNLRVGVLRSEATTIALPLVEPEDSG